MEGTGKGKARDTKEERQGMGKGKGVAPGVAAEPAARGGNRFGVWLWHDSGICRKSTLKWVAALVVSINLLLFALLTSDPFHRQQQVRQQQQASAPAPAAPPPFRPQVLATFVLQLPADSLNDSIAQLQADLALEIAGLNHSLRVYIMSVEEAGEDDGVNSTVTFAVVPDAPPLQQQPRGIDQLRTALINIFLNESNINLDSPFGPASQFQILKFPGGLTMQPDYGSDDDQQQQQTSPVVLFNFTLGKNLVTIIRNYGQLKSQIAAFTGVVGAEERLDIKLTNEVGSTVHPPVVVQVSIASAVPGRAVPLLRLEQLAQVVAVDAATSNNLGLDMSTFGDVQALQLSYALVHDLRPVPAPAPPPSPGAPRHHSPPVTTPKPPPPPARGGRPPPPNPHSAPAPTNLSPPPPPPQVLGPPVRMPLSAPSPVQPPLGAADLSSSPLRASQLSMLCLILPAIVLAAF